MSHFGVWFPDKTRLRQLLYHMARLSEDLKAAEEARRLAAMMAGNGGTPNRRAYTRRR